jgi:hypothetical protein
MIKIPRRNLSMMVVSATVLATALTTPAQAALSTALTTPAQAAPHFSFSRYATVSPAEDWSFVSGQFAGNNKTDVMGYHPSNGSLWVGRNTD